MHIGIGRSGDETWQDVSRSTARRDTLVTTSATGATRATRVQARRLSVDWNGHVHLTFSRSCSWNWCKSRAQKTKLVHASTTASSSSAMLEQARLDTLDTSYVSCSVETWRVKWNLDLMLWYRGCSEIWSRQCCIICRCVTASRRRFITREQSGGTAQSVEHLTGNSRVTNRMMMPQNATDTFAPTVSGRSPIIQGASRKQYPSSCFHCSVVPVFSISFVLWMFRFVVSPFYVVFPRVHTSISSSVFRVLT